MGPHIASDGLGTLMIPLLPQMTSFHLFSKRLEDKDRGAEVHW